VEKLVVLKLEGELARQGVRATLEIGLEGERPGIEVSGELPASVELAESLQQWQQSYRALGSLTRINPKGIKYEGSIQEQIGDCRRYADALRDRTNTWLQSPSFRSIDTTLREELSPNETIRILIRTQNSELRQLPWQLWSFFDRYSRAEFALSATETRRSESTATVFPTRSKHTPLKKGSSKKRQVRKRQVRILAILGHDDGINIQPDRQLLEALPNTEVTFLIEPQRQEINDQLWEHSWDILFFAGHSETAGDRGWIEINPEDRLTMEELKYCLKRAIDRGLQLAIFNSCDGLGLARQLEQLQLPQAIVMRELVPDQIAQAFLKYFLTAFAQGNSLHLAERQARERLHVLEPQFPCASWLPVICQNPATVPLTWEDLLVSEVGGEGAIAPLPSSSRNQHLQSLLILNLVATICIMGLRFLGILQTWELRVFDQLMRLRPPEAPDKRLLIIEVDEADIRQYGHPLSDEILLQLLEKLQSYNPAAIGLDIVRDQPVPKTDLKNYQALLSYLKQHQNIIPICAFGKDVTRSIAQPDQIKDRQLGFVDLFSDSDLDPHDDTVRRYLLSRTPTSFTARCNSSHSLGVQLAYQYFDKKNVPVKTSDKKWQFGSLLVKRLENRSGGYQTLDNRGNQLLISYRNPPDIAYKITVRDLLTNSTNLDPALIEGRVVLIGVTAASVPDDHDTPYGEMRGLFVHAHVVSQLLSAVEDQRPLWWWWPQWGDALWIIGWSCVGGIVIWWFRTPLYRGLAVGVSLIALYGTCWLFILQGGWIPLVPSVFAFGLTGVGTIAYIRLEELRHTARNE